jgi:hypothetical protein
MPNVVADTSVNQYLFQIDYFCLLSALYGMVTVPLAVQEELQEGRRLGVLLPNLENYEWIQCVAVDRHDLLPQIPGLGQGEREVLSLVVSRPNFLALLDDGLARRYANQLDIKCSGTLGVLLKAKQTGLIDKIKPALDQLIDLGFRASYRTRVSVLKIAEEI